MIHANIILWILQLLSVQIKSVKVDVLIINHVAEVKSSLIYLNKGKSPVSSVFSFPQDERTTVYELEADIDGQHIITKVQKKPQVFLQLLAKET